MHSSRDGFHHVSFERELAKDMPYQEQDMPNLRGKVALVTGASRGVGKGVALGLGEAGVTVYITGRTVEEGQAAVDLPGTIHQTVEEVNRLGGRSIAVRCDHRNDEEVKAVFARIAQ